MIYFKPEDELQFRHNTKDGRSNKISVTQYWKIVFLSDSPNSSDRIYCKCIYKGGDAFSHWLTRTDFKLKLKEDEYGIF